LIIASKGFECGKGGFGVTFGFSVSTFDTVECDVGRFGCSGVIADGFTHDFWVGGGVKDVVDYLEGQA
jgi:hypothetical protein